MEGQKTQWTKEKGQKEKNDLQNITQKTKDRATRTPLSPEDELMCSVTHLYMTTHPCLGAIEIICIL